MHYRFFRDSFWGRVAYHLSSQKLFRHKEEFPDYVVPEKYLAHEYSPSTKEEDVNANTQEHSQSSSSSASLEKQPEDEYIIVTWDGDDDPENPQNWPIAQKSFFIILIALLTMSVYMGSAIYTPGVDQIQEEFGVGAVVATLPLALFVIGYGIGPMVFSPMSENAIFGRTSIYIVTLFIFFILQIPTALVKNIAGLCILRFIAGFFASPALSTGGASVADLLSLPYIPVGLATWAMGAVSGPSLGPLIGSAMIVAGGWRWTFWFMAILSGAAFLILGFMLPETYSKTLLNRKAKRLRKLTGNQRIKSEGEIENAQLDFHELAVETLWRPIEITLIEPVVLSFDLYIALVYSIMYLWFEAFPMVFAGVYKFSLVPMGVSFVAVIIGIIIAAVFYLFIIYRIFTKPLLAGNFVAPEVFMPMAILGSILMPVGVFIFGWTSAADIPWIAPMIGAAVFAAGAFLIFQTLFNALSASYQPQYLASVFASNCLFRSVIAGCFPLFARPLFLNLKNSRFIVGWGSTILGCISVLMISIPVAFYIFGPKLRARSKYAANW
ncbi:multidrug resistance protein 1 [Diutina catenulata]